MSDSKEKDGGAGSSKGGGFSSMFDGLKIDSKLYDAKVQLIHQKHKIGKLGNLVSLVVTSHPSGLLVAIPSLDARRIALVEKQNKLTVLFG